MEKVLFCNLCGGKKFKVVYRIKPEMYDAGRDMLVSKIGSPPYPKFYYIVRCTNCGLVFTNPRVEIGQIPHLYPAEIFVKGDYIRGAGANAEYEERIRNFILPFARGKKFLDVGCANGFFMKTAEEFGYEVYGIDIAKTAVEFALSNLNLKNVVPGTITDYSGYPDAYFDVVIISDVIEHLPDPKETLIKCFQLLTRGGIVLIITGDFGSPWARIAGKRWHHIGPATHLHYFSKQTLNRMLEEVGFRIEFTRILTALETGHYRTDPKGIVKFVIRVGIHAVSYMRDFLVEKYCTFNLPGKEMIKKVVGFHTTGASYPTILDRRAWVARKP